MTDTGPMVVVLRADLRRRCAREFAIGVVVGTLQALVAVAWVVKHEDIIRRVLG